MENFFGRERKGQEVTSGAVPVARHVSLLVEVRCSRLVSVPAFHAHQNHGSQSRAGADQLHDGDLVGVHSLEPVSCEEVIGKAEPRKLCCVEIVEAFSTDRDFAVFAGQSFCGDVLGVKLTTMVLRAQSS